MGDGLDELLSAARARVGQEIGGKYRLEALVGVGGTAAVYAATHRNGHRVAVKVSHRKVYASPALWARFLRESYLGNVLEHEGVVRVLDDDVTQDGAAYLVMELLQGASLRAIAAESPLEVGYVMAVGDAVLDVLTVAHVKGIVHRDVKPENIFLTGEGALKLLDFGVARQLGPYGPAVTTTGAILGTPAFMAPEQVLGRGPLLGPPTDLWSVGATLFTLITGQHVHEGVTPGELFVSAATRPARPLASVAPSCPPALCAVVDRALQREVEDRWADASQMRAALGEAFRVAFGRSLDPKTLLGRMAAELLPLTMGTSTAERVSSSPNFDPLAATEGETFSPSQFPPRPPGLRATGYRDLPATLRDVSSSPSAPRLVPFSPNSGVGFAPTERAPTTPPPERLLDTRSGSRPFLFQDQTLVSPGETLKRGGWFKTALAAVGLVAASSALGFGMSRARTAAPSSTQEAGLGASALGERRALLAGPARTAGGEADLAFHEAFQLWYDGAPSRARERFLDAARLDPSRAEAFLYAVVTAEWVTMADREHFARARSLRARLPAREVGLLEALEPMMAEPAASEEADARIERWAQAHPNDQAAKLVLAHYYLRARHSDQQIALAPQVGGAVGHWYEALAHLQKGEVDTGAQGLERC
ncbi:MAG: serine/threonine protein kinase, partial [Polyangiaceae bacterium]|nr:serine/threonine protein kinase [Polyangiaceae bacterium]